MIRRFFILAIVAANALAAGLSPADVLDVDFGTQDAPTSAGYSPNRVQPGFEDFAPGVETNFTTLDRYFLYPPVASQTYAAATVTVHDNPMVMANGIIFDDAGTVAGPLGPLVDDYLFPSFSDIFIELSGLAAGTYSMTTYHHQAGATAVATFAGITVDTGTGAMSVATDVPISIGFTPESISSATFQFTADGVNDVVVEFLNGQDPPSLAVVNGFTLSQIPEPGGAMLLAIGMGLFLGVWRRSRRVATGRARG